MTDQDYIKKAVKLADGFLVSLTAGGNALETYYYPSGMGHTVRIGHAPQSWLDALAAQLVRQVDALDGVDITSHDTFADLEKYDGHGWLSMEMSEGPDRTMNTIKAIVDSKVLEE